MGGRRAARASVDPAVTESASANLVGGETVMITAIVSQSLIDAILR